MTAKLMIDKHITDKAENCHGSLVLATDLTQAFDIISHNLLIEKIKHHGIHPTSLNLLKSFLGERNYFVEVQGYRSVFKNQGKVSVIQGSKNSRFLYTAFSIEVVLVPKIMDIPKFFKEIPDENLSNHKNINHDICQYVDDSSNLIGGNSLKELTDYTEEYFSLLKTF